MSRKTHTTRDNDYVNIDSKSFGKMSLGDNWLGVPSAGWRWRCRGKGYHEDGGGGEGGGPGKAKKKTEPQCTVRMVRLAPMPMSLVRAVSSESARWFFPASLIDTLKILRSRAVLYIRIRYVLSRRVLRRCVHLWCKVVVWYCCVSISMNFAYSPVLNRLIVIPVLMCLRFSKYPLT